jgi:integrase
MPKLKPTPKQPYTEEEVLAILSACERLGRDSYERLRAEAFILLLRYTGFASAMSRPSPVTE